MSENQKQEFDEHGYPLIESPLLSSDEKFKQWSQFANREILEYSAIETILSTAKDCGIPVDDLEEKYRAFQMTEREQLDNNRATNMGGDPRDFYANEGALRKAIYDEVSARAAKLIRENS